MLWSDLTELRHVLEIDPNNHQEDVNLNFFLEWASAWMEELLGRKFVYKTRNEYYSGTGTQKMLLKCRPVFPNPPPPYAPISIIYNPGGFYGSVSGAFTLGGDSDAYQLQYGVDYCLRIDQDDGSSRSAILIRMANDYWYRPTVRQSDLLTPWIGEDTGSYLVQYTAGYSIDTLPAQLRAAANLLATAYRIVFPVGMALGSEGYEGRSLSYINEKKGYLLTLVMPHLVSFRNWKS